MRSNFPSAVAFVLAREGGYTFDKDDPGGETRWGISKRAHPGEDIKNLTVDRAREIYLTEYWIPAGCDELQPHEDTILFDTAVNQGKGFASEMLHECVGDATAMLFYRLRRYSKIVEVRPSSGKYLRGWMNRIIELHEHIKEA